MFDQHLSAEEQAKLDAEVKAMEEQNAKVIEVKAHKRDVRKPVLSNNLAIEQTHIYPEGVQDNPDYVWRLEWRIWPGHFGKKMYLCAAKKRM